MTKYVNSRNPILPVQYHVPDSEGHVFSDGKLYLYGSFDNQRNRYCSDKYVVVSTADMKHWEISEESFCGKEVPWAHDPNAVKYEGIDWKNPSPFLKKSFMKNFAKELLHGLVRARKMEKADPALEQRSVALPTADLDPKELLFAPDCIEKDGKYYLYFCMEDSSEGVAVADSPNGPFTNPVQIPVGGIDPAIFIDDDGSAYYYWGQIQSHGAKLNDDMISLDKSTIVDDLVTEEKHFFHEGSSMRKIGDTYYYVYADMERGRPTALGYSTSKSPLGPFTYRGIIIDNVDCDPQSWNNHGSIECVDGQWYIFYHRCSRNTQQYRRLCIEPITILPDGSIPEVKMTSQGPGEPFVPGEKMMGYQACELHGKCYIDAAEGADGNCTEKLTNLHKNDQMHFRYVQSDRPFRNLKVKATGSGVLDVYMNDKCAGTVRIQNGEQQASVISMPAGTYELMLKVKTADNLEIYELEIGNC